MHPYVGTIDRIYYTGNVAVLSLEVAVSAHKTQPPWEFLLSASRNSLQSFELSRLSHASNLRKEITQLLDSWLEENSEAMLARWLMEQRERPATREQCERASVAVGTDERIPAGDTRGNAARSVSDNVFADQARAQPGFRARSYVPVQEMGWPAKFGAASRGASRSRRDRAEVCDQSSRQAGAQPAKQARPPRRRTRPPQHRADPPLHASPPPAHPSVTSKQRCIF